MFTRVYLCLPLLLMLVYLYLPIFARVYMFTLSYICVPLYTHVYLWLHLLTMTTPVYYVYSVFNCVKLRLAQLHARACLRMFTYVYSCLSLFNRVYLILPLITRI